MFRFALPLTLCGLILLGAGVAQAQTGVDDDRVSLPDGPGSLEGVGDNVEIDPNMGTMRWEIPVLVPAGFSGLEPSLGLTYSSGGGAGVVGIGWSMEQPTIERMTTRGVPGYTVADRFAADGAEELVAVETQAGERVYRARYEGGFVRYVWVEAGAGAGGNWRAEYPYGRVGYYGADAQGQLVPEARTTHPDGGVFRYHLVELVDTAGHSARYSYDRFEGSRALLTGVEWVFVGGVARYSAELSYEERPDLLSDCGAGFEEVLRYRLGSIRVRSGAEVIREVVLDYEDSASSGGVSRLRASRSYGVGGQAGGELYPISFRFEYSRGLGVTCAEGDTACGRPYLVDMGTLSGGVNLASGNATLIDINGDSLPDVLDTSGVGPHRFLINTLTPAGEGFTHGFSAPVESQVATGSTFQLSGQSVQTLDINGDGYSDLINTATGSALLNGPGVVDWSTGEDVGVSALPLFTGEAFEQLRFMDYDGDKRIDVLQSSSSETRVFRNTGASFEAELVDPIGLGFATSNLQLADMNGDGLSDPVEVLEGGGVRFRLNLGRGRWGAFQTVPGVNVPPAEQDFVELEDLNGDGLDDIVVVVGTTLKYALNRNANRFDAFVTLTSADIEGGIPAREDNVTVLYADMNGNGSEDVVWFTTSGGVRYLELFPVRPNLLTKIENGIGMVQEITYGTSVEHAARAEASGEPWAVTLPSATAVVDQVDLYVTLTGAGDGSGVHEITRYDYKNGYYDGEEKQFRGFSDVVSTLVGDASQEEGVTRLVFDNGVADDYRSGLLLGQIVESDGRVLSETTSRYGECAVAEVPAGVTPPVRYVCPQGQEVVVKEGAVASEWVTLRTETTYDGYGNVTMSADHGVVARGGVACGAACLGDESYVETSYVPRSGTGGRWLINAPLRVQRYTDPAGALRSDVRYHYDGEAFVGLPEGQLTRGFLTRVRESVAEGAWVETRRVRLDADGNVVDSFDANGDPAAPNAHRRTSAWDESGLFLVESDVYLEDAEGAPYQLRRAYSYDVRFQKILEATDYMLVRGGEVVSPRNSRRYGYDGFGRLTTVIEPGDERATPTQEYTYALGDPVSQITIRSRSRSGGAQDEVFQRCFDGKGRKVQDRAQVGPGRFQAYGFSVFNNRGNEVESFQPYTSAEAGCASAPPAGVASTRTRYDAQGRVRAVEAPDAAIYGTASVAITEYAPLATIELDPEDVDPASPHFETPTVTRFDGLGRPVMTERTLREGGELVIAASRYGYDNLGNLASLTDPEGHVHRQSYDRLGRVLSSEAPNTGRTQLRYDAVGNVIEREDARGVTTGYVYDGVNRLVARFDASAPEASRVTWRYDVDAACGAEVCTNTPGRLASARYPLGAGAPLAGEGVDRMGYNVRGVRVLMERELGGVVLRTTTTLDNRNRTILQVHPDGTEVPVEYDDLGRVSAVPGFIDAASYEERGAIGALDFANGARQTWAYDAVLRVAQREVLDGAGGVVESRTYAYNRAGNITGITDGGPAVAGMPSLSVEVLDDAWYRPRSVALSKGTDQAETLEVRYGLLDQVEAMTSSLGPESAAHVGDYTYGSSQPMASTQAGELALSYDDAGYTTQRGAGALSWDYMGRLTEVSGGEAPFSAVYGADQTRVFKRDGDSLVIYASEDFEVRDGVATTYVRFGGRRIARRQSAALAPLIYPDLAPAGAPDDRITAADAFAAKQGAASGMPPELILSAAVARLLAEEEGETIWLHGDHLGSLTAATDEGGAVRGRRAFHPFGQVRAEQGYVDAHGFTGQEQDEATGLVRFAFRYFDPAQGRWLSADPAFGLLGGASLERLAEAIGAYSYVGNNPVSVYDPLGLAGEKAAKTKKVKKKKPKVIRALDSIASTGGGATFVNTDLVGNRGKTGGKILNAVLSVGALGIGASVGVVLYLEEESQAGQEAAQQADNAQGSGGDGASEPDFELVEIKQTGDATPELVDLGNANPTVLTESADTGPSSLPSDNGGAGGELGIRISP